MFKIKSNFDGTIYNASYDSNRISSHTHTMYQIKANLPRHLCTQQQTWKVMKWKSFSKNYKTAHSHTYAIHSYIHIGTFNSTLVTINKNAVLLNSMALTHVFCMLIFSLQVHTINKYIQANVWESKWLSANMQNTFSAS